jgi:hypothetical protein
MNGGDRFLHALSALLNDERKWIGKTAAEPAGQKKQASMRMTRADACFFARSSGAVPVRSELSNRKRRGEKTARGPCTLVQGPLSLTILARSGHMISSFSASIIFSFLTLALE